MIADLAAPKALALSPEDLVRNLKHLPSAPKVLPRLKRLLCDGNSSVTEIMGLIRLDPGIAARVLQMGNSAYFNHGLHCVTVDEAVHRVGYDRIYELVSYAVASQVLVRPLDVYGIEADEVWKMSVACALAAETIANRTGQDRAIAYTIGLLHNVGMVAIDEWVLRNARGLHLPSFGYPDEASAAELDFFGFTQAQAGAALLEEWEFSGIMSDPVRWQYAPSGALGEAKMATLLAAAKWVRNVVCTGRLNAARLPGRSAMRLLGLTPATLSGLATEVAARLREVNSLLESAANEFPPSDRRRTSPTTR